MTWDVLKQHIDQMLRSLDPKDMQERLKAMKSKQDVQVTERGPEYDEGFQFGYAEGAIVTMQMGCAFLKSVQHMLDELE